MESNNFRTHSANGKSVTISLNKNSHYSSGHVEMKFGDIVKTINDPIVGGKSWSMVTKDATSSEGATTVSMRRLNVSKIGIIRKVQLYILRKTLNTAP